jgi:catechol 2,3-dioxygenase-like lactoylglutathione lyase family enzyme
MIIHHISIGVRDLQKAIAFYDAVLSPLGAKRVVEVLPWAVAYGDDAPQFWVQVPIDGKTPSAGNGVHFCFHAVSRKAVEDFHRIALQQGGKDEGAPGPRKNYPPNYYGAFVRDLDGHKIEAACYGA